MANKKLKLLYLARFLHEETDEQHPKTLQDMLAYLAAQGITAERKSVYDDLELLSLYGLDVQSVRGKTYGYFLGPRDFQLPELKLLIDVVQASPWRSRNKSMELIAKLEHLTSRPNARQLRRQVYVMDRVRTPNDQLYYAVDGLHTAINDDRQVMFRYFDWRPDGGKEYRRDGALYCVDPVALCVDRHYYLVSYDPTIQDYRHYRVDRMEGLSVTDTPRDPLPENFDLGRYVKTLFDRYNGRTETVHLRFDRALLNVVMDRFGADAHIRPDGNWIAVTAPVEVGPTFYGWLAQFGPQAELTAPAAVRTEFAAHCRAILELYQSQPPPLRYQCEPVRRLVVAIRSFCLRRPLFFQQRKKRGKETPPKTTFLDFLARLRPLFIPLVFWHANKAPIKFHLNIASSLLLFSPPLLL